MRLRPIVRSVLCCLLCLTVCAAPAFASDYNNQSDGFLYWSNGASVILTNGSSTYDVLNGYFPATFSHEADISAGGNTYYIRSEPFANGGNRWHLSIPSQFYVEVLFSVPAPLTVTRDEWVSGPAIEGSVFCGLTTNLSGSSSKRTYANAISSVVDNAVTPLSAGSNANQFTMSGGSFDVKRFWGYRMYFPVVDTGYNSTSDQQFKVSLMDQFKYTFSDPNYVEGIYDKVTVNTGVLEEINGKLTEIQTSTATIQNDVSEIKNGLQDSNSSIWGAFKDSVSGLFVPSSGDLESVKNGFDQLAQDKLGGAYQTVDMVSGGVQSVTDKFKNPGSNPGVEFPGISVPLGGDVGTVSLAASQTVTIPEKITEALYPVAGVIIPIVCTIWTVRLGLDMVNCFMSGMSYGEFLHRHTSEEDDEV